MLPKLYSVGKAATLRAVRTDRFKAGLLSVSSVLPITRETACLAPLLLSVLHRGTKTYPTLADLNRRLDYLWGTGFSVRSYYRGNALVLGFSADLLDSSYLPAGSEDLTDAILELMREILFCPLLDADGLLCAKYVESEKQLQCDTVRSLRNSPRGYAAERCRELMYRGEPCGIPLYGTVEQTEEVTREELTAFWRRWTDSLQLECFYVGSAELRSVQEKLERVFGSLPAGNTDTVILNAPGATRTNRPIRRAEETLPVSQSQLFIGLRSDICINHPQYYACTVMNELLGGSPVSRLFSTVREQQSLCYSCSSVYRAHLGTVLISCGLAAENRAQAEREIMAQLELIRQGQFSAEELEAAKKSLCNAYLQLEDSPCELEGYFLGRALAGNQVSPEECRAGFAAVTAEEITQVANLLRVDTVYFLRGTLTSGEEAEDDEEADV